MTGAAAIARILKAEGTEYLFCFPVSPLIDECARLDIRPIVGRTERAVVNMADGYSRASNGRKLGVVTVQQGPGAENAYAGIAQAFADGSPLLFLPGGNPRGRRATVPYFDAADNYRGVTKWSAAIGVAGQIPSMLRRAFTLLRTGRLAPVALEVPVDVAGEEIAEVDYGPVKPVRAGGDPDDVREAARILLRASRPILHVGQGALWAEACEELRALAELVQAPVMTTLPGKSAFPESHPLSLGTGGYSGTAMVGDFLQRADVIVGIGCSFTATVFAAPIPKGKVIVHVTNNEADVNKDVAAAQSVLGDAKLILQQLLEEVKRQGPRPSPDAAREVASAKEAWRAQWLPKLTSDEVPVNPYRVISELMRLVDRSRTIITHDSGMPRDQLAPFWETLIPRGYLGWGKSTQLGSSLGFALGAKLAAPDKLVVHFLGDTALGMCGMDLEAAARERIPILTVLANNGLMGGYERYIPLASQKYRSRYLTGDYTKVAEGLGVVAERVTQPAKIGPALQRALAVVSGTGAKAAGPALVEVMTCEETQLSKPW
jgi:acetolactate synthase-1/2/3 large subunit